LLPARALTRARLRSIVPRHIQLAIRNDEELSKLLGKGECTPQKRGAAVWKRLCAPPDARTPPALAVTIAAGGVLPNIHSVLLPKAGEGAEPKGKGKK